MRIGRPSLLQASVKELRLCGGLSLFLTFRGSCEYQNQDSELVQVVIVWGDGDGDGENQTSINVYPDNGYAGFYDRTDDYVTCYFAKVLDAVLYNQTNETLTLDPSSVQNQDREFYSQPPASIAPQGQGTWKVSGTKGSCTYQYGGSGGVTSVWWDKSDSACGCKTSGQGSYQGKSDVYPGLKLLFSAPQPIEYWTHPWNLDF